MQPLTVVATVSVLPQLHTSGCLAAHPSCSLWDPASTARTKWYNNYDFFPGRHSGGYHCHGSTCYTPRQMRWEYADTPFKAAKGCGPGCANYEEIPLDFGSEFGRRCGVWAGRGAAQPGMCLWGWRHVPRARAPLPAVHRCTALRLPPCRRPHNSCFQPAVLGMATCMPMLPHSHPPIRGLTHLLRSPNELRLQDVFVRYNGISQRQASVRLSPMVRGKGRGARLSRLANHIAHMALQDSAKPYASCTAAHAIVLHATCRYTSGRLSFNGCAGMGTQGIAATTIGEAQAAPACQSACLAPCLRGRCGPGGAQGPTRTCTPYSTLACALADAFPGQSGSPAWTADYFVRGVLHGTGGGYTYFRGLTDAAISWILSNRV